MIGQPTLKSSRSARRAALVSPKSLLFVATTVAIILGDRWTKELAVRYLLDSGARSVQVVEGYLRFSYVENRGAAFGLFQEQTTFFIVVGLIVIGVILASYRYMPEPSWLLNLCLGLQMGGAVGNLIDRVRVGYVVDFIELTYKDVTIWPVFNIADSAICVGVAGLALSVLFPPRERDDERRA